MTGPRAVLLDLWHTIAFLEPEDEDRYMEAQIETTARVLDGWPRSPRGRHPALHDARRAAEEVRAEAVMAARKGVSLPLGQQALHAAHRLGRRARPLELSQAMTSLVLATPFQLCPGVRDTLSTLKSRGYRLGVVSNTLGEPGDAWLQRLDRVGVGELIDAWAFSDQLPWAKPAPEIFWHCLGMLGVARDRAVHVGDGWSDLTGARAAELRAGILYTGAQRYGRVYGPLYAPASPTLDDAAYRFSDWADLPALADRLLPE